MIDIVDLFNACLYIQDHLEADLSLMFLAQTVGLSRFRFHRVFKAWRGETLHDFVTRMRMERAAFELSYPIPRSSRRSIKSIALASGYKSLSSFSHAFSSYASLSPREFRYRALQQRPGSLDPAAGEFGSFKLFVGHQPQREIAVLERLARRDVGPRRRTRAGEVRTQISGERFGVELLPNLMARARGEKHESARIERLGCVGVSVADWSASQQPGRRDVAPRSTICLAAGRYAVIEGRGSFKALYRAWRRGFDPWLMRTGECPKADRIYVRFPRVDDADATIALYVPMEDPVDPKRRPTRVASRPSSTATPAHSARPTPRPAID